MILPSVDRIVREQHDAPLAWCSHPSVDANGRWRFVGPFIRPLTTAASPRRSARESLTDGRPTDISRPAKVLDRHDRSYSRITGMIEAQHSAFRSARRVEIPRSRAERQRCAPALARLESAGRRPSRRGTPSSRNFANASTPSRHAPVMSGDSPNARNLYFAPFCTDGRPPVLKDALPSPFVSHQMTSTPPQMARRSFLVNEIVPERRISAHVLLTSRSWSVPRGYMRCARLLVHLTDGSADSDAA